MKETQTRDASINIRALPSQRSLIDRAAARNKTRSDFIPEAACNEAENVLLDRRLFCLDDDSFEAFEAALRAPVEDNPSLAALLDRRAASLLMKSKGIL